MHTKPMKETEGTLSPGCGAQHPCRACGDPVSAVCELWKSSCGGYEDYKITCVRCGYVRWEEGIDS